jgi:endoglucanase
MIFLLAIIIIQILSTVLFTSAVAVNNLTIVQTPDPEYVRLLSHSILFYEAQRSGKLPNDNRLPW